MSRNAPIAASERINCVRHRDGFYMRLQPVAIDNVDRPVKQACDIGLQADIAEQGDARRRVELYHDVDVAVGAIVPARSRAEQGRMADAAGAQRRLVVLQPGDDLVSVHRPRIAYPPKVRERSPPEARMRGMAAGPAR